MLLLSHVEIFSSRFFYLELESKKVDNLIYTSLKISTYENAQLVNQRNQDVECKNSWLVGQYNRICIECIFFILSDWINQQAIWKTQKRSSVIVWSTINSSFFRRNYYTVVAAIYKATTQGTLLYVCGPENYCDYKSITAFSHFFYPLLYNNP